MVFNAAVKQIIAINKLYHERSGRNAQMPVYKSVYLTCTRAQILQCLHRVLNMLELVALPNKNTIPTFDPKSEMSLDT